MCPSFSALLFSLTLLSILVALAVAQNSCNTNQNPYCAGNSIFEQICCPYPNVCYWQNRNGQPGCCPAGQVCDGSSPYTPPTPKPTPTPTPTPHPTTITITPTPTPTPKPTIITTTAGGGGGGGGGGIIIVTSPNGVVTITVTKGHGGGVYSTVTSYIGGAYSTVTSNIGGVVYTVTSNVGGTFQTVSGVLVVGAAPRSFIPSIFGSAAAALLNLIWNLFG